VLQAYVKLPRSVNSQDFQTSSDIETVLMCILLLPYSKVGREVLERTLCVAQFIFMYIYTYIYIYIYIYIAINLVLAVTALEDGIYTRFPTNKIFFFTFTNNILISILSAYYKF
jgi:hypothetical protein